MKVVMTICSKEKDSTNRDLTAHQRYKSTRIKAVSEVAKQDKLPFFILSGKYGLVAENDIIPYYDYLLEQDGIEDTVSLVNKQSKLIGITSVDFYAKPKAGSWAPYYEVLESMATELGIELNIISSEPQSPNTGVALSAR